MRELIENLLAELEALGDDFNDKGNDLSEMFESPEARDAYWECAKPIFELIDKTRSVLTAVEGEGFEGKVVCAVEGVEIDRYGMMVLIGRSFMVAPVSRDLEPLCGQRVSCTISPVKERKEGGA